MKDYSVISRGVGKIAIYSVPKQTFITKAITNNEENRKALQARVDQLNRK
jgi:hypothetical protein